MKMIISNHARERFLERGIAVLEEAAQTAFDQGNSLTQEEKDLMFRKGIRGKNYWGSIYRKYKGLVWIFGRETEGMILKTIIEEADIAYSVQRRRRKYIY